MGRVCPSWLSFMLYNPLRRAFTDRQRILDESNVTEDSVVLEVGAGNGFITEALAARAREVISVELQEGMVRKLRKRVGRYGSRVRIIVADISAVSLGNKVADVCLLYYSFHEIQNKTDAVAHIANAVRTGGTLAIFEPVVEVGRKTMENTVNMFELSGFKRENEGSTLFTRSAFLKKKT